MEGLLNEEDMNPFDHDTEDEHLEDMDQFEYECYIADELKKVCNENASLQDALFTSNNEMIEALKYMTSSYKPSNRKELLNLQLAHIECVVLRIKAEQNFNDYGVNKELYGSTDCEISAPWREYGDSLLEISPKLREVNSKLSKLKQRLEE